MFKIAVIGTVSTGKSTLINALLSNTYSDMKLKRTTMNPQVYNYTENDPENPEKIVEMNRKTNEEYKDKKMETIKVSYHRTPGIEDLEYKKYIQLYDLPGINDVNYRELYYKYLEENIDTFNIILFTVDTKTAFNTEDEKKLYDWVTGHLKYHQKVIVCANKCDDPEGMDEKDQIYEIKKLTSRNPVLPIMSKLAYYYRLAFFTNTVNDELAQYEFGKSWKKKTKEKLIEHFSKTKTYDTGMEVTGLLKLLTMIDHTINSNGHMFKFDSLLMKFDEFKNTIVVNIFIEKYDKISNEISKIEKEFSAKIKDNPFKSLFTEKTEKYIVDIEKVYKNRSEKQNISTIDVLKIIEKHPESTSETTENARNLIKKIYTDILENIEKSLTNKALSVEEYCRVVDSCSKYGGDPEKLVLKTHFIMFSKYDKETNKAFLKTIQKYIKNEKKIEEIIKRKIVNNIESIMINGNGTSTKYIYLKNLIDLGVFKDMAEFALMCLVSGLYKSEKLEIFNNLGTEVDMELEEFYRIHYNN